MRDLPFQKYAAFGNSFLVVVCDQYQAQSLWAALAEHGLMLEHIAIALCDPDAGFGADGLILGLTSESGPVEPELLPQSWAANLTRPVDASTTLSAPSGAMLLFNSDGSRAELSGNGLACLGYVLMRSGTRHDRYWIDTDAGIRQVVRGHCFSPTRWSFQVHMPIVRRGPEIAAELRAQVAEDFGSTSLSTADVGNPHLVIATDGPLDELATKDAGSRYESFFDSGINVEFIARSDREHCLQMSVWERGAGVTDACGSGAVVSAQFGANWELVVPTTGSQNVFVDMPGGTAMVSLSPHLSLWTEVEHLGDFTTPLTKLVSA